MKTKQQKYMEAINRNVYTAGVKFLQHKQANTTMDPDEIEQLRMLCIKQIGIRENDLSNTEIQTLLTNNGLTSSVSKKSKK